MKKNILTIIILAATIVNLTLSAIVLFAVVPTTRQVNNLVTKVVQMLDLEIQEPIASQEENKVDVADMTHYAVAKELVIPLTKIEGDTKNHYVVIQATVTLNSKAEDYETINELIPVNDSYIQELIHNVASEYTYDTVLTSKLEIKQKVLASLKEYFDTECIIDVIFSNYVAE